jgi:hypothetical protein
MHLATYQAVLWIPDPMGGLPCLALVCGFYPVGSDCRLRWFAVSSVGRFRIKRFNFRCALQLNLQMSEDDPG